ncbi:hypothetical protein DPMN_087436 [Dreissena polymorpha]|uniref:Uncharacterized protein n=1 Tax=Dreissena polymorpha TaxID=45954 RepID=A0A9D4KT56_DREPO|nr:hypothetical protein DPMN_087436 [Dreissena polymorpha]
MDNRHVHMGLPGNNKVKHVTSASRTVDSRRQAYTAIQIPRPSYSLERRPSVDMGVIARMRSKNGLSVAPIVAYHSPRSHETSNPSSSTATQVMTPTITQQTSVPTSSASSNPTDTSAHSPLIGHQVITQMSLLPRSQTTSSTAIRLVHPVTEIRPILKGSRRKQSAESSDNSQTVSTAGQAHKVRTLDPKFQYRLPDKPDAAKFQKSVSFKEDIFSSKINRRHMTSPVLSSPYSVFKADGCDRKQIFV